MNTDSNDVERFNRQISNFLEALHKIVPENKDIPIFQSQLETLTLFNKKVIVDGFIKYVYPHKEQIKNKDDTYFVNEDLGNLGVEEDQMSQAIHLKELWKNNLSKENKEVVWKYFNVFIILVERIINKNNYKS